MGKRTGSQGWQIAKLSLALVISCSAITEVTAQDGEQLFKQNCTACHKIGARLVGPDLTGVTDRRSEDWIKSFIKNSQGMVKAGDADAVAIFDEFKIPMTSFPLSDAELSALVTYLGGFSAKSAAADAPAAEAAPEVAIEYTDEDVATGRSLFQGGQRLSGGGPSCIACHNVTNTEVIPGGLLAKDLTNVFTRMGHAGIAGILGAPPFPAMNNAYGGNAALTETEIHALAAFFKSADEGSDLDVASSEGGNLLLLYGFGGLFVILIIIGITWKNRLRKSVKHDINERQLRSI